MGPWAAEDGGNTSPLILNGRNQPIACNHHADCSQHNLWASTLDHAGYQGSLVVGKDNQVPSKWGVVGCNQYKRPKIHG